MYDIKLEKSHERLLSIFQNTFAKLSIVKRQRIVKLYFSIETGKNVQMKTFKK